MIESDEQTTDGLALALPPEKEPAETQLVTGAGMTLVLYAQTGQPSHVEHGEEGAVVGRHPHCVMNTTPGVLILHGSFSQASIGGKV